jgi:hypothetical protein
MKDVGFATTDFSVVAKLLLIPFSIESFMTMISSRARRPIGVDDIT